jgi:ribosomal protein S18 acetylase RimI-like enzyme
MSVRIEHCDLVAAKGALEPLAAILRACVHGGASLGFILPFELSEARAYWTDQIVPALEPGELELFIARIDGAVAGTVQLHPASRPNQAHRAEVSKLLVHPDFRRRGVGRALMAALETRAAQLERRLLTLDTACQDKAEPLYRDLGFVEAGRIPGYARDPIVARLDATILMFKQLA